MDKVASMRTGPSSCSFVIAKSVLNQTVEQRPTAEHEQKSDQLEERQIFSNEQQQQTKKYEQ
jgi:hypothetical protein